MTDEDEESRANKAVSPNPRRGERRTPPVIEGTAQDVRNLPPEAEEKAKDPHLSPEATEPSPQEAAEVAQAETGTAPHAPERRASRRGEALAVIALLLAVLALAATAGLGWRSLRSGANANAGLRSQIAALTSRVAALEASKTALGKLDQRVANLAENLKTASSNAETAQNEARQALAQAKTAAAKPADAANPEPDLTALEKRIAALEKNSSFPALQSELVAQGAAATKKLTALGGQLAEVDRQITDLHSKIAAQDSRLNPLEALLKAPKIDVAAIQASTTKAVNEAASSALIVVARALQKAVDLGAPYAGQVAAAENLGADPVQLKALRASAKTGVLTAASLRRSFEPLVGPILAGVGKNHAKGFLGRLASGLGKLVRVRAIGQTTGNDPVSLVGQIESALTRGDVDDALAARRRLPPKAKAVTEKWAAQAEARIAAQKAARSLLNDAIDRLGKART